jgi:hypothetical protein
MRTAIVLGLRVLALAALLLILLGVAAQVTGVARAGAGPSAPAAPPTSAATAALAPVLFCLLGSAVFTWLILRSAFRDWPLTGAVFLAYFGLGTVMLQMESALFLPRHLPAGFLPRLFAMGALIALFFAPAAAWMYGRFRKVADVPATPPGPGLTTRGLIARLALLAVVYVALYFLAGYFIAYRNPELVAYYDDIDAGSFAAGMARVWERTPWLFALQALRGVMWVALVLPFIFSFRGPPWELPLLVGSAFSVWVVMLLASNPYMPESVRLSHLVETGSSNFLFGCLVGAVFARSREPRAGTLRRPAS